MAQQDPTSSSTLPVYYGERMQDGTIIESPRGPRNSESRDALLRLPIQQPNQAHLDPEPPSPTDAVLPADPLGINGNPIKSSSTPKRIQGYPLPDKSEERDYNGRTRKYDQPYGISPLDSRPSVSHRRPFLDDYYYEEDRDRQRLYNRPSRRHTRPPLSHGQTPGTNGHHVRDRGQGSFDSIDWDGDTPTKPRYPYRYSSEDEGPPPPPHLRAYAGGGGYRGPPRGPPSTEEVLRLPWTMWMNSDAKNHFVAFIGEFVGTTMFLFFAFSGTQVANIGSGDQSDSNTTTGASTGFSPPVLQYIALVFAFSLMVNVWIFFRISGGLFNPAVTFAMLLTKAMTPIRFALLLVAQLAGAIFSSFLVSVLFPTNFNVRTTLSAETSLARGVFIEAVLTAELIFTIFMLAKEKHKATYIAPVGIGLALFIAELVGVYYTGGSLNPARSFGPCVVAGVFDQEHWIYWIGPGIGAIIAVIFYRFIKILEYEVANPGQDDDDKDQAVKEKSSFTTMPPRRSVTRDSRKGTWNEQDEQARA